MKSRYDFPTEQEWLNYLRVYFAGMALQGLMCTAYINSDDKSVAKCAVTMADELIEALNKTEK